MAGIIADVSEDIKKLQQIKAEIADVKKELKSIDIRVNLDIKENLEARLKSLTGQYNALITKIAATEGEMMLAAKKVNEAMNGISSDPLKSFDAELLKMCDNLNKYFDGLLNKMESMSSLLQMGKTGIDDSTANNISTQQLEELRAKNKELTEQLRSQKEEIKQQQEEWNELANAIKTNNVSAIEQYKQATSSSSDTIKSAKSELRALTKDLDENIKYYDKLAVQIASYKSILDRLYIAKEKGMTRVPIGDGATALISTELERFKPQLDDVTQKSKEIALQISEQRKRQSELNTVIEQGNEKHLRTRTLIMDSREQLIQMRAAGLQNTVQYQQAGEELGKMRKQMVLVNAEMAYLSNPDKNLATFKAGLSGIASSASLIVGVMGLVNQKNEEMVLLQTKIQSLLGIVVGLEGSYNMIKKSSILMIAIENAQRKASIASQTLEAKAKTTNIALTWSEVAAQKALNMVAKANPYVLLASAILTVIGGIWLLVKANKEAKNVTKDLLSTEQELALARRKAVSDSIKERTELDLLYKKLKDTSLSTKERNSAVNEWMKKYPQHSNIMNGELVNLGKLELAYRSLSKQIIESARARAYTDKITELTKKREEAEFRRLNSLNTLEKSKIALASNGSDLQKTITQNAKKQYDAIAKEVANYDSKIVYIQKKIKVDDLFPQLEKGTYDYWQQQVQIADVALKQIDSKQKALLDNAVKDPKKDLYGLGIDKSIVDSYKQAIKLKTEAEKELKVYDSSFKQESAAEKLRKEQEKYNQLLDKQALEQKRSAEDLQNQVDESRIKAMNEGSKKTIAQMELNFEKELQVIDRQKEDALRKKVEDARSAFESNPKNKGKSFDATGIKLSDDENKYFEELYKSAIVNNEKAYSELANQYLSYTDQRLAIEKKFNDDIALLQEARKKAEEKGDTDEVAKIDRSIGKRTETKNEDVFKLDAEQFKKSMNWEQVFGNLDKVSTDTLKKLKSNLKDFISAQKDLSPENLKELVDAIERIDDKVSERNLFEAMETSFKSLKFATDAEREAQEAYNKALKEGTDEEKKNAKATLESAKNSKQKALSEATTSLHKGVDEIGQYVEAGNEVIDIMKTLGVKTPEWLEGTMSGFGEILNGLSNIDLTKPMSIVTGGLQTIKGALTSVISLGGLIPGFGGADYSSYNEMVSKYDDLLDTWDALLEKKRAYINESYGAEAIKAGDEALDLLNTEKEITKQLADSRLNSGSSAGSHSLWYRMWKGSYKFEGQNWRDVAGDVMRGLQKEGLGNVSFNGMGDMLNMTSEQLLWIKKNYTGLWTTMDGDFRGYLEQLIEYGETEQSIIESIQDQLTQTSFDNVYSNFFDTLMDMKAEASDFSDDLNEMFMRSLLSNEIGTKYKNKLGEWYEKWSETMKLKDDAKRKLELEKLREEYEGYVNSAIQERNDLANSIGYTGDTESFSQSSTKKGFEAMSQDTGEELNGRFTALQAFNEEIKNQSVVQSQSLNLLTAKADTILSVNTEARNIADDTRDLIANSYLELMQISENTGNSAKYLKDIKADMAEVKKNTSKL